MSRGGARKGAGRNPLPENLKKQGVYLKFTPWVKEWLQKQSEAQGVLVEAALIKTHNLKEPIV